MDFNFLLYRISNLEVDIYLTALYHRRLINIICRSQWKDRSKIVQLCHCDLIVIRRNREAAEARVKCEIICQKPPILIKS